MTAATAGILLVALFLLLVLPSVVEISFESGSDGWHAAVRALGGLVRRCLAGEGRKPEAGGPGRSGRGWRRLAAGRRLLRPALYLLNQTCLGQLDVDLAVGLERADRTAWSVGVLWALGGFLAALVSRTAGPGSVRPRIRVAPCFGRSHFALAVRGRARVRVWYLLAALWKARAAWQEAGLPARRLHKFLVPGHIKVRRRQAPATKKTR